MIHGIGTDIIAVKRMDDIHARHGGRLPARLLAPGELAEYAVARDKARFLAKRFAAKEALGKALGTGMRAPVTLAAIAIVHDGLGRPGFELSPELAAWMRARGAARAHLSLSDEQEYIVAFVVVEQA